MTLTKRIRACIACQTLLVILIGIVGTIYISSARNTLHNNEHWRSRKVELHKGVVGGVAALVTRVPLYLGRLDLGTYFGYQHFYTREKGSITSASFRAAFSANSYLDILLHSPGTADAAQGIRLSCHPRFETKAYRVNTSGAFLDQRPLPVQLPCAEDEWVTIELSTTEGGLVYQVGEGPPLQLQARYSEVASVGFRGSFRSVLIDDILLEMTDGERFREDFSNTRDIPWALPLMTLAGLLLAITVLKLFGTFTRQGREKNHYACIAILVVVLICGAVVTLFDHYYVANRYPQNAYQVDFQGYENRIESKKDAATRILTEIKRLPRDRTRIMLVGTSQTWGAGALEAAHTMDRVLERALSEGTTRGCVVLNAGISGVNTTELNDIYHNGWADVKPSLVIFNLGTNDSFNPAFSGFLHELVGLFKKSGAKIVFVLEPNSVLTLVADDGQVAGPESDRPLKEAHKVMRQIAAKEGIPVVDMHAYFEDIREQGFLWWDYVHLTSNGQELFGEKLASELRLLGVLGGDSPRPGAPGP